MHDIKDLLRTAAPKPSKPFDSEAVLARRDKLRRRRWFGSLLAISGIFIVGTLLFSALVSTEVSPDREGDRIENRVVPGVNPSPTTDESSVTTRVGLTTYEDGDEGFSITFPKAWSFVDDELSRLVAPTGLFTLGSGSLPGGGGCAPTAAIRAMDASDVLIHALEFSKGSRDDFPERPSRFSSDSGFPFRASECWSVEVKHIYFRDEGRFFRLSLVLGDNVGGETRKALFDAINSLKFE